MLTPARYLFKLASDDCRAAFAVEECVFRARWSRATARVIAGTLTIDCPRGREAQTVWFGSSLRYSRPHRLPRDHPRPGFYSAAHAHNVGTARTAPGAFQFLSLAFLTTKNSQLNASHRTDCEDHDCQSEYVFELFERSPLE